MGCEQRHILDDFLSVDSGQPLSGWFSLKSILPKRGSAFYINGVISGFSHGREPLQLLLFWSFAHGCVYSIDEVMIDATSYNETTEQPLPRLIFACDEVAEMLDKTGADNERKKLLAQIENRLSTIARQGRAFGIHLILATQRPDATIIPGQIRNNMDFRVCGRADSVLSQIILDNTSAAEQIPKDARGRFITGDGTVFQGYLFDEGQL